MTGEADADSGPFQTPPGCRSTLPHICNISPGFAGVFAGAGNALHHGGSRGLSSWESGRPGAGEEPGQLIVAVLDFCSFEFLALSLHDGS